MEGAALPLPPALARMADPAPLLQATGLSKSYGPVVALKSATLEVVPGEVHAVAVDGGADQAGAGGCL